MTVLPPLPLAVPLLGAALLVGLHAVAGRRLADTVAALVAVSVAVMCGMLLVRSGHQSIVYWFGGWRPRQGVALGISFTVDPIGAAMATLCATMVTAALVFSWRYFDAVGTLFHALMLVFLAAMSGFCLSGDLFNIFVYFELMSVTAYALTGYKAEEAGPLQGALNFAVTNSVGAFLVLIGIALVYARTGALNLAQIGRALSGHRPDGLVVVAFVFLTVGFLVKGAVVPFHFWLADAHAVAPTPVCVLFSSVMVELGLYAAARVYFTIFHPVLAGHENRVRAVLVGLGVLTALVGGVMSLAQRHLKRLLAFSTVGHAGLFLIGFALLDRGGLAGAGVYVLSHALVKGALFMCAGILLHRWGTVQLGELRGLGRVQPITAAVFVAGGLGLAGLPPFGTALGKAMIEDSGRHLGYGWLPVVFVTGSALTGGAVLRAAGEVFLGWGGNPMEAQETGDGRQPGGARPDRFEATDRRGGAPSASGPGGAVAVVDHAETLEARSRTPVVMIIPAVVLVVGGLVIGLVPGLARRAEIAAARFTDTRAYDALVLDNTRITVPGVHAAGLRLDGALLGVGSAALAGVVAHVALGRLRVRPGIRRLARQWATPVIGRLRALHSGHVGDYVTWLTVGVTGLGGLFAALLR